MILTCGLAPFLRGRSMVVALVPLLAARLVVSGRRITEFDSLDGGLVLIALVYWAGSRDTLRHYYAREAFLLGTHKGDENDDERTRLRRWHGFLRP